MSQPITVTIVPCNNQTTVLVMDGPHQALKARLNSPWQVHPTAMTTLLQGISLWYQQQLLVVLSADSSSISETLGLTDGFGFGEDTLYYRVQVVTPRKYRPRGARIRGLGDFAQASRALRRVVQ